MKSNGILILLVGLTLNAAPADLSGTWKVVYDGPPGTGPRTVGSILLDLKVDGNVVSGTAHIGPWPGLAPIADGMIDGDHLTFTATGTLGSTTGIPTCKFDVVVHDDEMVVIMKAIKNAGGPLELGREYKYRGKRRLD
jgi:hypothetical protein